MVEKRQLADLMAVEQTQNLREFYPGFPPRRWRPMEFLLRNGIAPRKKVNASRRTAAWVRDCSDDVGLWRSAPALRDRGRDSGRARAQPGYRNRGKKSGS